MRAGSRSEFVDLLKPTAVWGAWGSNLGSFLEPPLQSCAAEPELLPWERCPQSPGLPRPGAPLCEIRAAIQVRARVVPEDVFWAAGICPKHIAQVNSNLALR